MKVRSFELLNRAALAIALAAILGGCGRKETGRSHVEKTDGVTFSEKHGLKVPEETAKFIGLEIAEVQERKVTPSFPFEAQVFRDATEAQFASTPSSARSIALATTVLNTNDIPLQIGTQVTVLGPHGKTFLGRISNLHATGGAASGFVESIVAVHDDEGALKRGETISAIVSTIEEKTVSVIPRTSLLKTAEGNFVYTLSGDHYVRTPIKVREVNGDFAEITEGLLTGDQVVVKPVMTLWLAELQAIRGGKACADGH